MFEEEEIKHIMRKKSEEKYRYDIGLAFVQFYCNNKIMSYKEVINRLNSLEKENEYLKTQLDKIPKNIREVWKE